MREEFKELAGMELSVLDLSNKLQQLGCEDICDLDIDQFLEDGNVVVATDNEGENHIQIFFEISISAGEDEVNIATELKIESVIEY